MLIYGSHERGFSNASMTQQGQDVSFVGRGIGPGSLRFGEGSLLAHHRITGSIQGSHWIASGSPWGAEGEHPWIVCLRKAIRNPPRYWCRALHDVDERHRLIHVQADQSELNYAVERSSIDHFDSGRGLGEPDAVRCDPYLDPWVSEAIRVGC